MLTNGDKLKSIVKLSQLLKDAVWKDNTHMSGTLYLDKQSIDLLVSIDEMDLDLVVEQGGRQILATNISNLTTDESVQVSFITPSFPQAFFAKSFDSFLPNHDYKYQQPALFYLSDQKLLIKQSDEINDPLISSYLAVLDLIELIEKNDISDYHPTVQDRYFLFLGHEQKFRLSITYTAQNLRKGGEDIVRSIERLKHFIEDGVHPSDKRLILKKTII